MLDYLNQNKEWIFSGIGVLALTWIVALVIYFIKRSNKNSNTGSSNYSFKQKSGKNSTNIQGHTLNINQKGEDK